MGSLVRDKVHFLIGGGTAVLILLAATTTPGVITATWWRAGMGLAAAATCCGVLGYILPLIIGHSLITGEIEAIDHYEMAQSGSTTYRSTATIYVRVVNRGHATSLLRWRVSAKDKYGNDVKCEAPYTQSILPKRSGPPFRTIHDLENAALKTGEGAEVAIGLAIEGSTRAVDMATLRVSFVDAWGKRYAIKPIPRLEVN